MRISHNSLKVLAVFLAEPQTAFAGSDLFRRTKIGFSTIYPTLAKLEQAGWFVAEWEQIDPKKKGRPAKRMYRLTPLGVREARARFDELNLASAGGLRWAPSL